MKQFYQHLKTFRHNQNGAAVTEFGFAAPIFIVLALGICDIAHGLYVKAILDGTVQKIGREAALQSGAANIAANGAFENQLRQAVNQIAPGATVVPTYQSFFSYNDVQRIEVLNDTNSNGSCDAGETFIDENNDQVRGGVGQQGVGGPQDIVLVNVNVEFSRLFPIFSLIGGNNRTAYTARTVFKNQPWASQATANSSVVRPCDPDATIPDSGDL